MTASPPDYVLGFLGDQNVHKANTRALLKDFIDAYKANHRKSKIVFLLAAEDPLTETMEDLADMAATSGFELGVIAHTDTYATDAVREILTDASIERQYRIEDPGVYLGDSIVGILDFHRASGDDVALILLGDPEEDDETYTALRKAEDLKIQTRSLLNGLHEAIVDDDGEEATVPEIDDEIDDDEVPVAFTDLDDDDDLPTIVVDEDEDDEIEDAEVVADAETGEVIEAVEDSAPFVTEEAPHDHPDPLTEAYLRWLAHSDRKAFYTLASEHDVQSGRGIKVETLINRVLLAVGQEPSTGASVIPSPPTRALDIDPVTRKDMKLFLVAAEAAMKVVKDLIG